MIGGADAFMLPGGASAGNHLLGSAQAYPCNP